MTIKNYHLIAFYFYLFNLKKEEEEKPHLS